MFVYDPAAQIVGFLYSGILEYDRQTEADYE